MITRSILLMTEFIQRDRQGRIIPPPGIMDNIAENIKDFRKIHSTYRKFSCPFSFYHMKCEILFPTWSISRFRGDYECWHRSFCPCTVYGVVYVAQRVREKLKGYINYPKINPKKYEL